MFLVLLIFVLKNRIFFEINTDLNLTMHLKENAITLHSCEGVTSTEIKSADKLD